MTAPGEISRAQADRLRRAPQPSKGSIEAAVARDRARGLPIHPEYGTKEDNKAYLKRKHRQRSGLLRQFLRTDGPKGNSEAYRDEHERIFGLSPRERAAEARRQAEAEADYRARVAEAVRTGRKRLVAAPPPSGYDGPAPVDEAVAGGEHATERRRQRDG